MDQSDIVEQNLYVPYSEEVLASVWCVDAGLQMFSNVPEDLAQINAPDYMDRNIYFFAELAPESVDALLDHIAEIKRPIVVNQHFHGATEEV